MTNWTEVNVYTGRPVDEDAPTNFAGAGSGVDMNPTGMKKKKKKLIDARSKSYKSHRAKLEAARVKREAKRTGVKEEVELDEMKKVEIKLNRGNVDKDIQKIVKHIGLVNKKRRSNQQIKITQNMSDDSVTLDGGKNVDIDREVADIRNFIGFKSAKVVESVNEGKMSQLHTYIKQGKTAKEIGKLMGVDPKTIQKLMDAYDAKNESVELDEMLDYAIIDGDNKIIGLYKGSNAKKQAQMNMKGAEKQTQIKKPIKIVPVSNKKKGDTVIGIGEEVDLDEREKSVRQLINPTKEVMIVKKNKVIVIDKKDQDKYMKQGWALAEQIEQSNGTKGE